MRIIGTINPEHFKGFTTLLTNEVVLTDERIEHIRERHPGDYELYAGYIPEVLRAPDYIIEANKPNSAVLMKSFERDGVRFQLVLRLQTAEDPDSFSNSIITFSRIHHKEWRRFLRMKKVLYKHE